MWKNLLDIYNHMGDAYSKEMYGYRLLYSLTGDQAQIEKVIGMTKEGKAFVECLERNPLKEKIIFGTGAWGHSLIRTFPKVRWDYFVDNYVKEKVKANVPVLSFDELCLSHRDAIIVISTRLYHREILEQLLATGFSESQIINMGKMIDEMSQIQYFELPAFTPEKDEVFVDVGCFDGATSCVFAEWSGNVYKHIYAFEPDHDNFLICKNKLQDTLDSVTVFECGLWDKKDMLSFQAIATGASSVSEKGMVKIQVEKLDDILKGEIITFLKMDVDGSEVESIRRGGI